MVSIQILENLFHAKCENGKLFPLLAVLLQKFLTGLTYRPYFMVMACLMLLACVLLRNLVQN